MSKIATFKKDASGTLKGTVQTMLMVSRPIELRPIEQANANAPSYRAYLAQTDIEIGAGWTKTGKDSGKPYVSVMLDDPTLAAPVYCTLTAEKDADTFALYWERPKAQSAKSAGHL